MSKEPETLKQAVLRETKSISLDEPDWRWLSSKGFYRNKVFTDTNLIISPHWGLGTRRCLSQPRVWVENKVFDEVIKLCDITLSPRTWGYRYQSYYSKGFFPGRVVIYDKAPEVRPTYFSRKDIPDMVGQIFYLGKKIFENELVFSDEKALLISLIETSSEKLYNQEKYGQHMGNLTFEAQAILRLLLLGEKEFVQTILEKTVKHGGSHRDIVPKILPHLDEIISMSPYL